MTFTETADWNDGYNGQVTVTAGSSPITGWTTSVTFPAGQKVSTVWNGSASWDSSGSVMTVCPIYNGNLAAGASTSFGFTVQKNGNSAVPTVGACTAS